ncbi:class I SAM-dependent methyltransferase [Terrimonas pollutisoli]|uniref:class I SAM-dependent methyltransferase n=1 Tax=Terrimonas pollutisoli TaxID=3034147 RepID=UPI0023EC970B|nr:class I SAM-dependent methyltransferase [Terrimonas sp. H1YJ31]
MSNEYKYPGKELEIFESAVNWKKYFARQVFPFLKGNVLEVGAGLGTTTHLLNRNVADRWLLLEPDNEMQKILKRKIHDNMLPPNCELAAGSIEMISKDNLFDAIVYIDVLEHIENDKKEIINAVALLKPGGHLIILAPAFQFLYSPFDKSIGHYRRYNKRNLLAIGTPLMTIQKKIYLDSMGFLASLLNKLLLRQSYPTTRQIIFWDKWLVPISKITDHIFFYSFGKSILAIWKKQ